MNKTLKTALITLLITAILAAGIIGYNYIRKIMDDNIALGLQKAKLEKLSEEKEAEREAAYIVVDSFARANREAAIELAIQDMEIAFLIDSLEKIPMVVDEIPPEDSYDSLQTRYLDEVGDKKYKFSQDQVVDIYIDVLSGDIYKGINTKLVSANAILKNQLTNAESIEEELRGVILGYEIENEALRKHLGDVEIKSIKVRTQRNIFGAIAGGALVAIGIIIGTK